MPQLFEDTRQGAIVELPVPQFPTGIIRGRFNPRNGQFCVLGMSAWATNQMMQVGAASTGFATRVSRCICPLR
jgi:hypothetical protein